MSDKNKNDYMDYNIEDRQNEADNIANESVFNEKSNTTLNEGLAGENSIAEKEAESEMHENITLEEKEDNSYALDEIESDAEPLKSDIEDYSNPEKYKYNPYTGERNIYYGPYGNSTKAEKPKKEKKDGNGRFKKKLLTAVICVLAVALVSSSSILVYSAVAGKDAAGNKLEAAEPGTNNSDNKQGDDLNKDDSSSGKLNLNTNSAALEKLLGSDASLSDIAENTIKSVVGISNYKNVSSGFQGFFGDGGQGSASRLYGEGSGVIITEDGYVITNQHVIDGSDALQVTMSTGEVYDAQIVGEDAASDLALLKIKTDKDVKFTPIVIGDSDELSVADYVMVVGNPGGSSLSSSVSFGIVSGKNRPVTISSGYTINMLQTDAAINPGNSGGALVNIKGELVGIPSAKYVATDYENLGFAININEAMPIIKELAEYGYVKSRGTIDINYQVIDRAMSQYYNLPSGLYVTKVNGTAGSLKKGDIITEVNGNQVYSEAGLTNALAGKSAGDEITIKYYDSSTNQYAETKLTLVESKIQSKDQSSGQAGSNGGYSDNYGNYYSNR